GGAGFTVAEAGGQKGGEKPATADKAKTSLDETLSDLALAAEGWVADDADGAVEAVRRRRCQDEVDQCVERKSAALDVGAEDGCARRLKPLPHTAGPPSRLPAPLPPPA